MGTDGVLQKLRERGGVVGAYCLTEQERAALSTAERKEPAVGGMCYDNQALLASERKEAVICVFSRGFLEEPNAILVEMMDDRGRVLGHDIPRSMRGQVFPGAIYVSDDFVVYPEPVSERAPRLVVLPQRLSFLGTEEGVSDAVAF